MNATVSRICATACVAATLALPVSLSGCSSVPNGMTEESYKVASEALDVAREANEDGTIFSSSTVTRLNDLDEEFDGVTSGSSEDTRASTAIGQIATGAQVGSGDMVETGINMLEGILE